MHAVLVIKYVKQNLITIKIFSSHTSILYSFEKSFQTSLLESGHVPVPVVCLQGRVPFVLTNKNSVAFI